MKFDTLKCFESNQNNKYFLKENYSSLFILQIYLNPIGLSGEQSIHKDKREKVQTKPGKQNFACPTTRTSGAQAARKMIDNSF